MCTCLLADAGQESGQEQSLIYFNRAMFDGLALGNVKRAKKKLLLKFDILCKILTVITCVASRRSKMKLSTT